MQINNFPRISTPQDKETALYLAQKGDLEAFNELVIKYQDIAFNTAYRILSNPEAAEDATQTAFLSAYRKIHKFRGGSFRAWIIRIVTNACYDQLRKKQRQPVVPLDFPINNEQALQDIVIDKKTLSLEEQIQTFDLQRRIQAHLNDMPGKLRAVIILIDINGMNYSEVSQALQIPIGTVKSRLARARLYLRAHMDVDDREK
ncbi:MAG: sigma-70 family RNA polymerase sigma factor [Anaerolineae bacterium]|nr:sigma-70 family RNA polymerase sigma factor [Anaerolineae bacterium]